MNWQDEVRTSLGFLVNWFVATVNSVDIRIKANKTCSVFKRQKSVI